MSNLIETLNCYTVTGNCFLDIILGIIIGICITSLYWVNTGE